MISLDCNLRLPSGHIGLLVPVNQQAEKGVVTVQFGVTEPAYQGEIELLLHKKGREEYVWIVDLLGHLFVFPCSGIKFSNPIQAGLLMAQTL